MILKIPLAWLQLSKEKIRLLVALAGIGFATILMFMQLGFRDALYDSAIRIHQKLKADLILISPKTRALINITNFSQRQLYKTRELDSVESVDSLYIGTADWFYLTDQDRKNLNEQISNRRILVIGYDPKRSIFDLPEINQKQNQIKLPDVALIDRLSRPEFLPVVKEVEQGKIVYPELEKRKIKIIGLFSVGASFGADGSLITSDLNFLRIFPNRKIGQINVGLINLKPGTDVKKVQLELAAKLSKDVRVLTRDEFVEFEKNYWQKNTSIGFIFTVGTIMGFIVGIVIVYQVLYTDVADHLPEYATLKAMGYTDMYLLGVVFQEALILSFLGYIPGFTVCLKLYDFVKNATSLPIAMTGDRAIFVLIMSIVMCTISGAIAVGKLRSADPADIF